MPRLTYPTECGTAAIMPPLTDVQRRLAALRGMDADLHIALIRDMVIHQEHDYSQRAAEALYAATEAKPNIEQAFAMAVASGCCWRRASWCLTWWTCATTGSA
ncbi:hypothetical protein G6F57_022830 [Rhizopus arrhizus]|nr:hypothetical protein G6F57_022830 [Rhizopus arrhizus]